MRKDKIYKIVTVYGSKIKTIGIIVCIFLMLITVKTYINYSTIIEQIDRVNTDIESVNEEIAYSKNFYEPYLDSDYAPYFLAHKNNTIFYNEKIIRLNNPSSGNNTDEIVLNISGNIVSLDDPKTAWIHFIKSKLK